MSKMHYFITNFQKSPSTGGGVCLNLRILLEVAWPNFQTCCVIWFFKLIMTKSN